MDRNIDQMKARGYGVESLSARRAWIEIKAGIGQALDYVVALRKESVDRNKSCHWIPIS